MSASSGYMLLDTGRGRRLELVGPLRIDRQAGLALWETGLHEAEWECADAVHVRSESGGGSWTHRRPVEAPFAIEHEGLVFEVQRTVSEGGTIETVVSQYLVPWVNINYVLVMEETT